MWEPDLFPLVSIEVASKFINPLYYLIQCSNSLARVKRPQLVIKTYLDMLTNNSSESSLPGQVLLLYIMCPWKRLYLAVAAHLVALAQALLLGGAQ